MTKALMIPIHVDVLYLERSETVAEPTADFRALPYFDSHARRDVNSDVPWLGESVITQPFENSNMTLRSGVHLHWALPDGLCHGKVVEAADNKQLDMPAVPNRWLIRRRAVTGLKQQIWIVESNYLWPTTDQAPAVNIFLDPTNVETTKTPEQEVARPYRFMGRKLSAQDWMMEDSQSHDYLESLSGQKLTALGYGEPTFAAYYPNCMTVFGFHDREPMQHRDQTEGNLQYDLVGWYSQETSPPELEWQKAPTSMPNQIVELLRRWRTEGEWIPDSNEGQNEDQQKNKHKSKQAPQQLICYASVELTRSSRLAEDSKRQSAGKPKVAIANTLSEALAAMLAREVAEDLLPSNSSTSAKTRLSSRIEAQLEMLHIESQLTSASQDRGLRLQRYRHQKSFDTIPGTERWTIQSTPAGVKPPTESVLKLLRQLNKVQAEYGKTVNRLEQARKQLYGDWCHYMRCAYRSPYAGRSKFLDIDELVTFIKTRSQTAVALLDQKTKQLEALKNKLEQTLKQAISQLNQALKQALEQELKQSPKQAQGSESPARAHEYRLVKEPGARFWQPTDPVVLVTGGSISTSSRHGQDGRHSDDGLLQCESSTTVLNDIRRHEATKKAQLNDIDQPLFQKVFEWLETEWDKHPPGANNSPSDCIGFRSVSITHTPWNPVFLDWGIDMYPAESRAPASSQQKEEEQENVSSQSREIAATTLTSSAGERYSVNIIKDNYTLGSRQPDLQIEALWTRDDPDRFSGRCILGDTPALTLKECIEAVLRRRLMARLIRLNAPRKAQTLDAYLDDVFSKSIDSAADDADQLKPDQAKARETVTALVGLWFNPGENWHLLDDSAKDYLNRLKKWYKLLAQADYAQIPLAPLESEALALEGAEEPLPTTPAMLAALMKWYGERPLRGDRERTTDPLYCILLAYQKLFHSEQATAAAANQKLRLRAFVGQALSSFNDELLQWKRGLSLPIDEPIGLKPYRDFTLNVAEQVGDETTWVSEPTNNFSPIRSGALKLDKLQIIDSFGKVQSIPCDEETIVSSTYQAPGRPGVAFLSPRLVQPARVTFRWLENASEETVVGNAVAENAVAEDRVTTEVTAEEMTAVAGRSPICGWLLPENLRRRLLVFDGDGNPLGALQSGKQDGAEALKWVRTPWLPRLSAADCEKGRQWLAQVSPRYYDEVQEKLSDRAKTDLGELGASLNNVRLARVLLYLWATQSPKYFNHFLNTLDDAIANIDPEGTASMGTLALLMGRPVAVVGAKLDLQLKDDPAIRQDWGAFRLDQHRHERDTDEFTQVEFRLRLGQYQSRNDGILGYWIEKDGGFKGDTFVAQAADENEAPNRKLELDKDETLPGIQAKINVHDGGPVDDLNFTQSVEALPLKTTILFDPRGQAHLTTGILPVKQIDIPRPLWEPALEAIQVWLPVAPFLSRPRSRRVPMPTLVDRQWQWQEAIKRDIWQTLYPRPTVACAELQLNLAKFSQPPLYLSLPVVEMLIDTLIDKHWLAELDPPSERLWVMARDERQSLANPALEAPLSDLLAMLSLALESPGDETDLNPGIEVREGWLLLSANSNSHQSPSSVAK